MNCPMKNNGLPCFIKSPVSVSLTVLLMLDFTLLEVGVYKHLNLYFILFDEKPLYNLLFLYLIQLGD